MVTITESTRRTSYQPTIPTSEFPVGFPIFDNDDLRVIINGEPVTSYTVSATYINGISENAVINMTGSGVIGDVIVEGARIPRRTDQYANGRPLAIKDHNYSLNRLTIENQEAHRDINDNATGLLLERIERKENDSALHLSIAQETSDRIASDNAITEAINNEAIARKAGDDALGERISSIESVVISAADRAENAADVAEKAKSDTEVLLAGASEALAKAETAVQPKDLGALASKDIAGRLDLSPAVQDSLAKADSAIQADNLGQLATKDKVAIPDINATGSATANTFLSGDGTWKTPAAGEVADNSVTLEKMAAGSRLTFQNRAALRASKIPERFRYAVRTAGYAVPGDGGNARWDYWGATKPSLPDALMEQDAGGNWWVIANLSLRPEMFGAKGDGVTDDHWSMQQTLDAAGASKKYNVFLSDFKTYMISGLLTMPDVVYLHGNELATLKKTASSPAWDFIQMGNYCHLDGVLIQGNRSANEDHNDKVAVRLGASQYVKVRNCQITNVSGHCLVGNNGHSAIITGNRFSNFYANGISLFHAGRRGAYHIIKENEFTNIGWGAILIQEASTITFKDNIIRGILVGGRDARMTVNISGSVITWASGPNFSSVIPGNFLVVNNGAEFRVVSKQSNTQVTVQGSPGNASGVTASLGSGDLVGIISSDAIMIKDNQLSDCATYGMGCSTMGLDTSCGQIAFSGNIIRFAGKNAISVSKNSPGNGQTVDVSVIGNKIFNAGYAGGIGSNDRYAILLQSTVAGTLTGVLVDSNTAISYAGEGQTTALFGKIGSVVAGDYLLGSNVASGTANGVGS